MLEGCHLLNTTAGQACPTGVRDLLPHDSCSPELKASSAMQRFGPESGEEGRAVHGTRDERKQPELTEAASGFSSPCSATAESTYFDLTGSFYWTVRANVTFPMLRS